MSTERDLVSWLIEFGYLGHPSPENVRKAFWSARAERGAERLTRELAVHEYRLSNRDDARAAHDIGVRGLLAVVATPCRT